jgi:hypothetical protein
MIIAPMESGSDGLLTIPAVIHNAVMALPPEERRDRAKVSEAVRKRMLRAQERSHEQRLCD